MQSIRTFRIALGFTTTFVLLGLAGCATTQHSQHYFAVADIDSDDPTVKYYRVTLKAKANNKNVELLSGYYDANAVRSLHGSVTEPTGVGVGASNATSGPTVVSYNAKTGMWESVNTQLYTVIFGADATEIASQVKAFAESEGMSNHVSSLLASAALGSSVQHANKHEEALSASKRRAGSALTRQAEELGETPSQQDAVSAIEASVRALAIEVARLRGLNVSPYIAMSLDELKAFLAQQ